MKSIMIVLFTFTVVSCGPTSASDRKVKKITKCVRWDSSELAEYLNDHGRNSIDIVGHGRVYVACPKN